MILSDIFNRNARRYPQHTAVVAGAARLSFAEFNRRINSLANAVLGLGLQKQDRVAIILDNCLEYLELYCALPKAGCVAVPLNTSLSVSELAYVINNAGARMLVFGQRFVPVIESLLPQLESVEALVGIGTTAGGARSYHKLLDDYPGSEPEVEVEEDDLAYLLYSSGTTGLPKGVMVTHRGIIASAVNYVLGCDQRQQDVSLIASPFFWGAASMVNITPQFYVGGTLVIADDLSPETILSVIQREKVTIGLVSPPMIISLTEQAQLGSYDSSSLRHIWFGGLPLPVESLKRGLRTLGNIFFQVYGMIELTPMAMVVAEEQVIEGPTEKVKRLASCGREPANVETRVVNDEGRDVPPGEVGEVIGRGDNLMKGYWGMPQATEEALRDGYLHTGDLATMDKDGYLYLVGRKKDVIVCRGKTIYPAEIEEVIYQHPDIAEVALIGVPDKELGESPLAVIVLRKGKNATEADILTFCRQNLPDYACPGAVALVEKLPRNPAGKVLRKVLQNKYCA